MGMAARAEIARRLVEAGTQPRHAGAGGAPGHHVDPGECAHDPGRPGRGGPRPSVHDRHRAGRRARPARRRAPSPGRHRGGRDPRPRPGRRARLAPCVDAGASVIELPVIAIADPPDGGVALRAEAARADYLRLDRLHVVQRRGPLRRCSARRAGARTRPGWRWWGRPRPGRWPRHHLVADLVADEETADGLVAAMPPAPPGDGRRPGACSFPRAVEARDVVAPGLRAKGWDVTEVDAYRTVAAGRGAGHRRGASSTPRRAPMSSPSPLPPP